MKTKIIDAELISLVLLLVVHIAAIFLFIVGIYYGFKAEYLKAVYYLILYMAIKPDGRVRK